MHSFRFILPTPHRLARHQSLHDLTSAKAGIDPASRLIVTANKIGLSISFPLALVEPLATRNNSTYVFERLWQCCCHIVAPDVIHPQPPRCIRVGHQRSEPKTPSKRISKLGCQNSLSHGAGEGNRTLVCSLGSCRSTIELRPRRSTIAKGPRTGQASHVLKCLESFRLCAW